MIRVHSQQKNFVVCVCNVVVISNHYNIMQNVLMMMLLISREVDIRRFGCSRAMHISVELLHCTSVQNMGNYQEYVKRLPAPMREIETQPARQHTFGNPFKVNKVT